MTLSQLLDALDDLGFRLSLVEGDAVLRGQPELLTPEMKAALTEQRAAITERLHDLDRLDHGPLVRFLP